MERTFLETVHFLGLDLELALVAMMVGLEGLLRLVEYLRAVRGTRPKAVERQSPPQTVVWPPAGWRTNH
ncbi:MAG TPA: hypothetical protein VF277_10735 [Steroidobacteraceae bacterium]